MKTRRPLRFVASVAAVVFASVICLRAADTGDSIAVLPHDITLSGSVARQTLVVEKVHDGRAIGAVQGATLRSSDEKIVKIDGGTAVNIVPKHCLFDFEFRHLPEHDPEAILREIHAEADRLSIEMRQVYAQAGFDFQAVSGITGLATSGDEDIVALVKQLTGINGTGKVSFGTEGGFYQNAGIPTVICGPGSIEQAHKPDEWIALEQITACERFMDRLIDRIAAE